MDAPGTLAIVRGSSRDLSAVGGSNWGFALETLKNLASRMTSCIDTARFCRLVLGLVFRPSPAKITHTGQTSRLGRWGLVKHRIG